MKIRSQTILTTITLLISEISSITYWKSQKKVAGAGASSTFLGSTDYYIIGQFGHYQLYELDFTNNGANTDSVVSTLVIDSSNAGNDGRFISNQDNYLLITRGTTVYRFEYDIADITAAPQFGEYSLGDIGVADNGYQAVEVSKDGGFFFTCVTKPGIEISKRKCFKLLSDREVVSLEIMLEFEARAVGLKHGSPYLIISSDGLNPRRVYDHTLTGPVVLASSYSQSHVRVSNSGEEHAILVDEELDVYITLVERTVERTDFNEGTITQTRVFTEWTAGIISRSIARVPNTTKAVASNNGGSLSIFDYLEDTEAYESLDVPSGLKLVQVFVSPRYRLLMVHADDKGTNYFYHLNEVPCWAPCLTCSDFKPESCLSCMENSSPVGDSCVCDTGYWNNGKKCQKCEENCLECGEGGCSLCKDKLSLGPDGDKRCYCDHGFWDSQELECKDCEFPCQRCHKDEESGAEQCLGCNQGFFLDFGACQECPSIEDNRPGCEELVYFDTERSTLAEYEQKIRIVLSRKLEESMAIEDIRRINFTEVFTFEYFDIRGSNALKGLTVKSLAYEEGGFLDLEFEEYLTVKNSKHLEIGVDGKGGKVVGPFFLKNSTKIIKIERKKEALEVTQDRKRLERASTVGESASIGVATGSIGLIIMASCFSSSLAFLIKMLQIIEFLSNLAKINVKLGIRLAVVLSFLQNLNFPKIHFLEAISPIKDEYMFKTIPNGIRGKLVTSNSDIFIFSGQNFIFSIILLISWSLSTLLRSCSDGKGWVTRASTYTYRVLLVLFLFDFQIICVTELATKDILTISSPLEALSLLASMWVLFIIALDFIKAFQVLSKSVKKRKKMDHEGQMILSLYTGDYTQEQTDKGCPFLLYDNCRFVIAQLIIATLQLLNRSQAFLLFFLNFLYFIFIMRKLKKEKIFESRITTLRYVSSEICIMVVLANICVFSLIEKSDFNRSSTYFWLENVAMFCVGLAIFGEVVHGAKSTFDMIQNLNKKSLKKVQPKERTRLKNRSPLSLSRLGNFGFRRMRINRKKKSIISMKMRKKLQQNRLERSKKLSLHGMFSKKERGMSKKKDSFDSPRLGGKGPLKGPGGIFEREGRRKRRIITFKNR